MTAQVLSVLFAVVALVWMHDHLVYSSYLPAWRTKVAPIAAGAALVFGLIGTLPVRAYARRHRRMGAIPGLVLTAICSAWMISGQRGIVCGETADHVICSGHLRMIGIAALMYANSHRGEFPPDFFTLVHESGDELESKSFVCPESHETPARGSTREAIAWQITLARHCSYIYAGAGKTIHDPPATTVIAYEPASNHSNDGMNVVFADSHVEWVLPASFAKLNLAPTTSTTAPSASTQSSQN